MKVLKDITETRQAVLKARAGGAALGLVPTMGALHEGHLSLVRAARRRCDSVAVSIFVNPAQFCPGEDLDAYPTALEADLQACEQEGVDIVFTPEVEAMYPARAATTVHVSRLTKGLCGASRPGHFDGVATVVAKLFNILPADFAFFGEKDYQQLQVIRRMVTDLNMPIEIVGCPIVREPDGLAMSSRNAYLNPPQRRQATCLSRALFAAVDLVGEGERNAARIVHGIRTEIEASGLDEIDYVEVVDAVSLEPVALLVRPARICLAVRVGSCRLIDNVGVDVTAESG